MNSFELSLNKFSVIKEIKNDFNDHKLLIEDKNTKKQYIAKISYSDDLTHELSFLKMYCHPTLSNLIGYSQIDFKGRKQLTLVTEFASNGSLQDLLNEGTLDNTQKQIILVGICRGMMLLHSSRTIIRTLIPKHILIDENFYPHISDFSNAEQIKDGKEIFYDVGNTYYMAPEVFNGKEIDTPSDVFSYAILMFQLITNLVRPYNYVGYRFRDIFDLGVRPVSNVPVKLSIMSLIERSWSADPDERPTFDELFHKLAFESEFYLDGVDTEKLLNYMNTIKN